MNSRGPPDHLPTEPPALLLRHYGFTDTVYYPMTPATTPLGTTTQRDQHLHPRRMLWAPELRQLQRRELNTDSSNAAVRDNSNGTQEGSTETTGHYYTAGWVLPTATPPNRVLLHVDPDRSSTSSPRHLHHHHQIQLRTPSTPTPRPGHAREGQPREYGEPFYGHPGQLQHGFACPRVPPPRR